MTTKEKTRPVNKFGLLHLMLILGLTVLLCAEAYFGYQLHKLSDQQEELKEDYANINNIRLGLFSIGQWRNKMASIVNHQVRHFTMTRKQKKSYRWRLSKLFFL